jgi:hypothetical protein
MAPAAQEIHVKNGETTSRDPVDSSLSGVLIFAKLLLL